MVFILEGSHILNQVDSRQSASGVSEDGTQMTRTHSYPFISDGCPAWATRWNGGFGSFGTYNSIAGARAATGCGRRRVSSRCRNALNQCVPGVTVNGTYGSMMQYVSVCCVWPSFLPFLGPCSQDAYSKLGEFRREFVFVGGLLWFYYVFAKHPCYHCLGRRTTKLNYHLCVSQKMILNVPNHCDPRARFGPLLVSRGLDQNLIMY